MNAFKEIIGAVIKNLDRELYKKIIDRKNIKHFDREGRLDFKFDHEKYSDTFISYPKNIFYQQKTVDEIIYCFWTGDNEMSEPRKKGLQTLIENSQCKVTLITPENLDEYVLKNFPLHEGYRYLTLNHRSDYLRCYFMHFYGGGFADVKPYRHSWMHAFKKLNNSDKLAVGYREVGEYGVASNENERLYKDMVKHYPLLIGNGAFIFKPNTEFTKEWINEVNRRMDAYYPELERFSNGKSEYPIPYTGLQGNLFHPLCLKYHDQLLQDDDIKPIMANYK